MIDMPKVIIILVCRECGNITVAKHATDVKHLACLNCMAFKNWEKFVYKLKELK